jgi:uncharacterized protein YqeY
MRLCLGASRAEVNPTPLPRWFRQIQCAGELLFWHSRRRQRRCLKVKQAAQDESRKPSCESSRSTLFFARAGASTRDNVAGDAMREQFTNELKVAMKAGQKRRVDTIRMINAALKDRDIEARGQGKSVSDEEILALLQKLVKSRQESAEIYEKAGRTDLSTQEREEIAIIQSFLPQPLSTAEVEAAVEAAIAETGAASIKDMGKVVGVLKSKYAGRFDVAKASGMVKTKLGG